jgi:hypothetical protein
MTHMRERAAWYARNPEFCLDSEAVYMGDSLSGFYVHDYGCYGVRVQYLYSITCETIK